MITSPIFTTDKKADTITVKDACRFIKQHYTEVLPRLTILENYYTGQHSILERKASSDYADERVVVNYASYISNFMAGYMLGQPVTYKAPEGEDMTDLTGVLNKADAPTQDSDLALDASVFGCAFDMAYMSNTEKPYPKLARLSPLNTFVVYDDTVEQNPVFAVYYYPICGMHNTIEKYKCSFQTDKFINDFEV